MALSSLDPHAHVSYSKSDTWARISPSLVVQYYTHQSPYMKVFSGMSSERCETSFLNIPWYIVDLSVSRVLHLATSVWTP